MYTVAQPAEVAPFKRVYDANYKCEGLELHLEWAKGHRHSRHVRLAACLQLGKDIVPQANGGSLCFYASKGIQYPFEEVVREGLSKSSQGQ